MFVGESLLLSALHGSDCLVLVSSCFFQGLIGFPEVEAFFGKLGCLLHHISLLLLVEISLLVHYNQLDHYALANTFSIRAEESEDYLVLASLLWSLQWDYKFSGLSSKKFLRDLDLAIDLDVSIVQRLQDDCWWPVKSTSVLDLDVLDNHLAWRTEYLFLLGNRDHHLRVLAVMVIISIMVVVAMMSVVLTSHLA